RGVCFFFSSRRRHTRSKRDWSSDVCSSDLAAGGEFTLLLRRLVGWHGARIFVFVLGTHGGAPSDLVGDVQGVSNLEAPPPGAVRSEERRVGKECRARGAADRERKKREAHRR